jgi:hypothetical protein
VPVPPVPVNETVLLLGVNIELIEERVTAACVALVIEKLTEVKVIMYFEFARVPIEIG